MKTIQEIYTQYRIMPSLQLHQYRVAAVASFLCEHATVDVSTDEIIMACLLHDMGNIIKFKLDLFPEFLEPEGAAYWKKVQEEYVQKYGHEEHVATIAIAKEIFSGETGHAPPLRILDAIGFSNAKKNHESADYSRKIAEYADMRVEPHGVVSLSMRLEEGRARYDVNKAQKSSQRYFDEMAGCLYKIEAQIFESSSAQANDITDQQIYPYLAPLRKITIGS